MSCNPKKVWNVEECGNVEKAFPPFFSNLKLDSKKM